MPSEYRLLKGMIGVLKLHQRGFGAVKHNIPQQPGKRWLLFAGNRKVSLPSRCEHHQELNVIGEHVA